MVQRSAEQYFDPLSSVWSALVAFHVKRVGTRFSEKRLEFLILGLDSLLLQAYNPRPAFINWKWMRSQGLLLEGFKIKALKRDFRARQSAFVGL